MKTYTINYFMEWFTEKEEQVINVWDCSTHEMIYTGAYKDTPDDIDAMELASVDNLSNSGILVLNVFSE